jgi:hypothetical protein
MNLQNMGFKLMTKNELGSCHVQIGCQKDGCKNSDKGEQHVKYLKRKIYLVLSLSTSKDANT